MNKSKITLHSFYRNDENGNKTKLYGLIIYSPALCEFSVFSSTKDRFEYVKSLYYTHGIDYTKTGVYNLWDDYIEHTPFSDYLIKPLFSRLYDRKVYVCYG